MRADMPSDDAVTVDMTSEELQAVLDGAQALSMAEAQERIEALERRCALLERRAENAETRAAEAERREGEALARAAMALAGMHGFGGAADGGSEATQAAQDSLSSAATGAGAATGEQPAPASAPGQQDGAGSGRADGYAAEALRAASEQGECPLIESLKQGGALPVLLNGGFGVLASNECGSVAVDGNHVAIRLAPGGAE